MTVYITESRMDDFITSAVVAVGALCSHFLLDALPHGFIAKPASIFKEAMPTVAELVPGPLLLITVIWFFDTALLFLLATACGILPDAISTLYYKKKKTISSIPLLPYIHALHRKVHWFETDHPDGSSSSRFPNKMLLGWEALFTCGILFALFR